MTYFIDEEIQVPRYFIRDELSNLSDEELYEEIRLLRQRREDEATSKKQSKRKKRNPIDALEKSLPPEYQEVFRQLSREDKIKFAKKLAEQKKQDE